MLTEETKILPIDPAFTIQKHMDMIFSHNSNALDSFAILMGKLNDAPCRSITLYYNDTQFLIQWMLSTSINPVNVFVREELLAFSGERKIKRWFAFLQKSVMLSVDQTSITIYYTYHATELVQNLCEYIRNLFNQYDNYGGKIYIMNEEHARINMIRLKDTDEKEHIFSGEIENTFDKIAELFSKKKEAQGVVVIAGQSQKLVTSFIKRLTHAVSRRFVYVSQQDAPNFEYNYIDNSFGKGINVFIIENAEEYPGIKDVFAESLAGYVQQLLKGNMNKAFDEPLIVTYNGGLDDFPELKNLKSEQLFLLELKADESL